MNIAFLGGGNMAAALIGGLLNTGTPAGSIHVIEVDAARRAQLQRDFGVSVGAQPDDQLRHCTVIVLAVKPQQLREVCVAARSFLAEPLVLSIAAGIRAMDIARWLGTRSIVRSMPNTPALAGKGMTGIAALAGVTAGQRDTATRIMQAVGSVVWFNDEAMLDPVTAISGSGPAYVFYFIEALQQAGIEMGFSAPQARALAVQTFVGAAELASASDDPVSVLRDRVTSKGGTTAAALASMDADDVKALIVRALHAANRRAHELGDEFGKD
jgi:pyrroline-5-carboxylate reductase